MVKEKYNIVAVTDHNSFLNSEPFIKLGEKNGIMVFAGAEIQTSEDIHTNIIVSDNRKIADWQKLIDDKIGYIKLNADFFGDQVLVDENENILDMPDNLLLQSIDFSFNNLAEKAYKDNVLFFPTHIHTTSYAICTVLGFIPDLKDEHGNQIIKLVEIADPIYYKNKKNMYEEKYNIITNSDAHYIHDLGSKYFTIDSEELNILYDKWLATADKDKKNQIKIDFYNKYRDFIYKKSNQDRIINFWKK